jgi:hypothetical protein
MMSETYPPPESLILVAVMNDPRDLDIARLLGWYRIPLRSAPKVVMVDYLAFYQTAAFGEEKWRIQYIAPVNGHELTTRKELLRDEPDHPHANREYYKIQLGALQRLSKPILAENWRRVTFLYTTGEHLLNASTLQGLVVSSEERASLWQALRERASQSQAYSAFTPAELPALDIAPQLLSLLLGIEEPLPGVTDQLGDESAQPLS